MRRAVPLAVALLATILLLSGVCFPAVGSTVQGDVSDSAVAAPTPSSDEDAPPPPRFASVQRASPLDTPTGGTQPAHPAASRGWGVEQAASRRPATLGDVETRNESPPALFLVLCTLLN